VPEGKSAPARRFVGAASSCAACHRDVHEGRFDRPGRPPKVGGAEGCARCHATASFRALSSGFDHAVWTGHPLAGAHSKIDCAACHRRLEKPDASGRTLAVARGKTCQSCHPDPHVAQFGGPKDVRCNRCHTETSFKPAAFDHQKDSRFALDKTHAKLACAGCHKTVDLPGGGKTVRYKPLGTKCGDCHVVVPEREK